MKYPSLFYFIHGTHINERIWNSYLINEINRLFSSNKPSMNRLIKWSGINSTLEREKAAGILIDQVSQDLDTHKPHSIILVGHSHGGTIALLKSDKYYSLIPSDTKTIIITLNTPAIVDGATLLDERIDHYNIIAPGDLITPIAGFNKTGKIYHKISNQSLWQKIKYGEFSNRKSFNSGKHGTVLNTFPNSITIPYKDQYWLKGINPKTHFTRHRGYLKKNVMEWIPLLEKEMRG